MPRTIAIGDIHGCSAALETLLDAVRPCPDDTIVTLGDYVDRGPDSRGVIDLLLELATRCRLVPLLGNHELMMVESRDNPTTSQFWLCCGGQQTLESYGSEGVPEEHWQFIRNCRLWHEDPDHIYLHANYDPRLAPDEQPEDLLFWTHLTSAAPPAPHYSGKTVVVGHTPQPDRRIADFGHLLCLDTCCFGGGCLTACELPSRKLWQADIDGRLLRSDSPPAGG